MSPDVEWKMKSGFGLGLAFDRLYQRIDNRGTKQERITEYLIRITIPIPRRESAQFPPDVPKTPEEEIRPEEIMNTVVVYWLSGEHFEILEKQIYSDVIALLNILYERRLWRKPMFIEHRFLFSRKVKKELIKRIVPKSNLGI